MPNIMTYDEWFKANGNKGNWGGYQQYVMKQGGGKVTRQQDNKAEAQGWSGQNMPDQSGMRAWAKQYGFSEDFDRFDERTLNSWMQYKDDKCPPHAPFRAINGTGCVEKPIDTNYNAKNAAYLGVQPAAQGTWVGPNGEVRGGGGGQAQPAQPAPMPAQAPAPAPVQEPVKLIDPLQQRLMDLAATRGGFFANDRDTGAASFGDGGVWTWGGMNPQQQPAQTGAGTFGSSAFGGGMPQPTAPQQPAQTNAGTFGGNAIPASPFGVNSQRSGTDQQGGIGGNPFFAQQQQPQAQQQSDQFVGGMSTNPLKRKLFDVYGNKSNSPFG